VRGGKGPGARDFGVMSERAWRRFFGGFGDSVGVAVGYH